jgi:hypothetical protein
MAIVIWKRFIALESKDRLQTLEALKPQEVQLSAE